jgi:hypothetical protein
MEEELLCELTDTQNRDIDEFDYAEAAAYNYGLRNTLERVDIVNKMFKSFKKSIEGIGKPLHFDGYAVTRILF